MRRDHEILGAARHVRDHLFIERPIDGLRGPLSVPGALRTFALDVLATCRLPFEQADRGVMLLLDKSKENLLVIGQYGVFGDSIVGTVLAADAELIGGALRERRTCCVECAQPVDGAGAAEGIEKALGAAISVVAPIADDQSCLGILALLARSRDARFSEADETRLGRKAKFCCGDVRELLGRPDVGNWYHDIGEKLAPSMLTDHDVHVLFEAFGTRCTTGNEALAGALTADVGEALRGLGIRTENHAVGAAKRYSPEQVQTLLSVFGVEVTTRVGGSAGRVGGRIGAVMRGPAMDDAAMGEDGT